VATVPTADVSGEPDLLSVRGRHNAQICVADADLELAVGGEGTGELDVAVLENVAVSRDVVVCCGKVIAGIVAAHGVRGVRRNGAADHEGKGEKR
jgi:hypothetical protein